MQRLYHKMRPNRYGNYYNFAMVLGFTIVQPNLLAWHTLIGELEL